MYFFNFLIIIFQMCLVVVCQTTGLSNLQDKTFEKHWLVEGEFLDESFNFYSRYELLKKKALTGSTVYSIFFTDGALIDSGKEDKNRKNRNI